MKILKAPARSAEGAEGKLLTGAGRGIKTGEEPTQPEKRQKRQNKKRNKH